MLDELLQRFHQHDRQALSRLLSLMARGEQREEILDKTGRPATQARVVAFTGSGGVGKSTLVGKLIESYRARGQSVAVLACDPQSPLSGGALLGDRFRMPAHPDDGVFIRSLAAVSGQGAVAEHLAGMVQLLETFGFELVLVETVGAGQGDTAVHELADGVVLLLQPEAGDDLQWEKAGIMEVADVVAIHKADLPGAERAAAQVRAALDVADRGLRVPVICVSSRSGVGIQELMQAVDACPLRRGMSTVDDRGLLRLAQEALAVRFAAAQKANHPQLTHLLENFRKGKMDRSEAFSALLHVLTGPAGAE